MPRLAPLTADSASAKSAELLQSVSKKLGRVPNIIATMAHSPATATAYLGFSQALTSGVLPASLREQIALVVGQNNQCDYCVAAHSAIGAQTGLSSQDILDSRRGLSQDRKTQVTLQFAQKLVQTRGQIEDQDLRTLREQQISVAEITEIVAHVALNIFTNYFNHVAGTDIDFPAVPKI